ncbi:hypothetical protein MMC22_004252, partial [Lobaria immixta]|nr:hypothetical protein [Lobaria immixta]
MLSVVSPKNVPRTGGPFRHVAVAHDTSAVALAFQDATLVLRRWAILDATVSSPDRLRPHLDRPSRGGVSFDPVGRDFVRMLLETGERPRSTVVAEEKEDLF